MAESAPEIGWATQWLYEPNQTAPAENLVYDPTTGNINPLPPPVSEGGVDPVTGTTFPAVGWGAQGNPPTGGNPPGQPGTFPGPFPFPSQGQGQPPQTGGRPMKRPGFDQPSQEDWWKSLGKTIGNFVTQAWQANPFNTFNPDRPLLPGFNADVPRGRALTEGEEFRQERLAGPGAINPYAYQRSTYGGPESFTAEATTAGGERSAAYGGYDPRVAAQARQLEAKKAALEESLGRPLTDQEEQMLRNRTLGPNVGQPPATQGGEGGASVGQLAFMLNAHQISEADAYRAAWQGGFRGSFRDFLVEKDRIIHQSGVNRGGGGGAPAYSPAAPAPVTPRRPTRYYNRPMTRGTFRI